MQETESQPIIWEKGKNDLEYFASLAFDELSKVLENEEVAIYYATQVTYRQESRVYRPNPDSPTGDGFAVRPETKLIFTIGDGVNSNMRLAKDFTGAGVRTKKSDGRAAEAEAMEKLQLANYKPAEEDEVRATVGFYLDGENNVTADMAFAEISDIFYNPFHLETTDAENALEYQKWENLLLRVLGINKTQIIKIIAAKYHFRLFKNHGKNGFEEEDKNIKQVIDEIYPGLEEIFLKERASNFMTIADIMFKRVFRKRLKDLHNEYRQEEIEKEDASILPTLPLSRELKLKIGQLLRGHKVDHHLKSIIRGETHDPIFKLSKEETHEMARMASTIALILNNAELYQTNQGKQKN